MPLWRNCAIVRVYAQPYVEKLDMATIPITKRGAEKLKAELHQLKTVERPNIIQAIAEARAQGDLSENAE